MTSFYVGPGRPRLAVNDWDDVIAAVQVGAVTETQWCESKEAVPASSPGANLELARDLASLTVDGGALLVGVRDKATSVADVVGIPDAEIEGLRSRIDQVAGSRVSPQMHLRTHVIKDPAGSGRSVLVIDVPASMSAPHMVDERYWGRSATGKRPLADGDVTRLIAERRGRTDQFKQELLGLGHIDPVPTGQGTPGRLYVMTQPAVQPSVRLRTALGKTSVAELLVRALIEPPAGWINIQELRYKIHHPDGLAAASEEPQQWTDPSRQDSLMYLLIGDDAKIQFVSGGAVATVDGTLAISLLGVCEAVQQLSQLAAHLSDEYLHYAGPWQLGVHLTGLKGLLPAQAYYPGGNAAYYKTPFQTENYTRTATVSTEQLADPSSTVVETVLKELESGLGLMGRAFPYASLAAMSKKLTGY